MCSSLPHNAALFYTVPRHAMAIGERGMGDEQSVHSQDGCFLSPPISRELPPCWLVFFYLPCHSLLTRMDIGASQKCGIRNEALNSLSLSLSLSPLLSLLSSLSLLSTISFSLLCLNLATISSGVLHTAGVDTQAAGASRHNVPR
jgi:hypothetical protein